MMCSVAPWAPLSPGWLWRLGPGILQLLSRSLAQHKRLVQVPLILSLCQIEGQRRVLEDHEKPRGKRQGTLTYGIAGMLVACNTARNIDSHDTLLTSRNNPVSNQVPKSTTSPAEQSKAEERSPYPVKEMSMP